jgi:hypothetical protein
LEDITKHGYALDEDIKIVIENDKLKYFELEVVKVDAK